ncbi:MerR family transcriptional regulator [Herbaspirillum autotrophicum]|uniref:MerR family transcriptional regulator n=1 Tax=Herbaspirillum autotrophicum TaxID=180195 RepID=UPI00067E4E8D|nr:MerR family transcriptional regulator [Herbaspirillum autotrophicum]
MQFKIGELARRSGLSVRALRHYDDIGLLKPSARAASGYRLYGAEDIARLYRIQALRRLEVSLKDIALMLDDDPDGLRDAVARQLSSLAQEIRQATALQAHLTDLQRQLEASTAPTVDDWLTALESMVTGAKYFSHDELTRLKTQRAAPTAMRQREKAALSADLKHMLDTGVAPESRAAMSLACRWIELLLEETQGNEAMLMKLHAMHWHEPALHALTGIDQAGIQFIAHAMAHSRLNLYAAYCSPEEMAVLRTHYVNQTDAWPPLIGAMRDGMLRGLAPDSAEIQVLARRWQALSLAKAGGDLKLHAKLQHAFQQDAALRLGSGIDAPLMAYVGAAMRSLQLHDTN